MRSASLEITPGVAERVWDVEGVAVLRASVTVPEPVGEERAARRMRHFYALQSRSFLRYCETVLLPQAQTEYEAARAVSAPTREFSARLSYRVTYNENGLCSLYTVSREETHELLVVQRGDTWDLTEGCPVPMSRFFPRRSGWKRRLIQLAAAQMEQRQRAGVSCYCKDWQKRLRRAFHTGNYYLTEEGLAYFLPMYAVGTAAEGIPTFILPWNGETELLLPQTNG